MRKFLVKLLIIQEKTFIDKFNKKVLKGRLNPYNPLSYIFLSLVLILGVVMYGILGIKDALNMDELKLKWVEIN